MDPLFITKLVFVALIVVAMLMDLIQMRIPNIISLAMVLLFPVAYLGGEVSPSLLDHLGAMGVVLVGGIALFACKILGGGDVKFLSSLALWTGFSLLPTFIIILSLVGGAQVILLLILRRFSVQIEYILAKLKLVPPEWLQKKGGVPYGVSIGIAILIVFDRIPFWQI